MIFFGSRGKVLAGGHYEGMTCSHCQHQHFHAFGVVRYFHIYWISMFPTSRKLGLECSHCRKTLMDDELPKGTLAPLKKQIFTTGRMLPRYAGLILIGVLFLAAGALRNVDLPDPNLAYISEPKVNDYYVVNFNKVGNETGSRYKYGVMKVVAVENGDVELVSGNYTYKHAGAADKAIRQHAINKDNYFDDQRIHLTHAQLMSFNADNSISYIERD